MNDDSVLKSETTSAVPPQASPQGNQRPASRPPQVWEVEKDFTDGTSGITVRISVLRGFRNRYSLAIGRMLNDQFSTSGGRRFVLNVPVFVEVELARVTIRPYIDILMELVGRANEHIHNAAQLREDEIIEYKQMGESKEANKNKPQTRHTGKTQRIKDRRTGKGSNQ
jgi:hypothetical protein